MSASEHAFDRRKLLAAGAIGLLQGACQVSLRSRIVGSDHGLGHQLRDRNFPLAKPGPKVGTLIVGAGASGAAAAYTLKKAGYDNFQIIDLAIDAGGNARAGHHGELSYPWGAHYLPQPDHANLDLLSFLEDAGAITGRQSNGKPIYNEDYLCHDIEERLHYQGRWHEGLIPWRSLDRTTVAEMKAFYAFVDTLRSRPGQDGRPGFHIPLALSSQDENLLKLDRLTFAEFIKGQGWTSPFLAWYLNYACRDDYGTDWQETSAWAGLHYFSARLGDGGKVLTWPEGNHWLIRQLLKGIEAKFQGRELAHSLKRQGRGWALESWSEEMQENRLWQADRIILALPRYVIARLLPEATYSKSLMSYAPWMVANCQVSELPGEGEGTSLAWDNVPYGSNSLGYVVASHQQIRRYQGPSVLTSYWPLTGGSSDYLRMIAGMRSGDDWARLVLNDMEGMHPDYSKKIEKIDVWLWGHGMIQPKPGFLWGSLRASMNAFPEANLAFAHSDMSGISIFEEAFSQGVAAARHILKAKDLG
jgi:predicted NAD/FAD-dependent oxidoreductase